MAIYSVNFRLVDEQARTTSRTVVFDSADETALLAAAALHATDLQAMSKCGLVEYAYTRVVDVSEAAAAGSNIDAGATFGFETALAINPVVTVPDPVEAIKDGQGGIDLTDLIVTDWFANYNPGEARVNINNPVVPSAINYGSLDK